MRAFDLDTQVWTTFLGNGGVHNSEGWLRMSGFCQFMVMRFWRPFSFFSPFSCSGRVCVCPLEGRVRLPCLAPYLQKEKKNRKHCGCFRTTLRTSCLFASLLSKRIALLGRVSLRNNNSDGFALLWVRAACCIVFRVLLMYLFNRLVWCSRNRDLEEDEIRN